MRKVLLYLSACIMLFVQSANLYGQSYTDEATWLGATNCQTFTSEDFDSFVNPSGNNFNSFPEPSPLTVAFGTVVAPGLEVQIFINTSLFNSQSLFLQSISTYNLIPASPSSAVGFTYFGKMTVVFKDGETILDSVVLNAGAPAFYGWADNSVSADKVVVTRDGADAAISVIQFGEDCSNGPPTADAGLDQSIRAGDTVTLDGSGSFDDNTASASLVYAWTLLPIPASSFDPSSITPSFIADIEGTYIAELTVTDAEGLVSTPDAVVISSVLNMAPTAVATSDVSVALLGDLVTFDSSDSSDPEGEALTSSWSITAAPVGSSTTLVDADTSNPTLTPDVEGEYIVELVVSDSVGPSAPAEVEVMGTNVNDYAEALIFDAVAKVRALTHSQVTSRGNKRALRKHLAKAVRNIQRGHISKAISRLNKAITRTDGCPLRGSPDGNGPGRDWVTDCNAQFGIYNDLTMAVDLLDE